MEVESPWRKNEKAQIHDSLVQQKGVTAKTIKPTLPLLEQLNGIKDLQSCQKIVHKYIFREEGTLTKFGLRKSSPLLPEMTLMVMVLDPLIKVPAGTATS